MTWLWRGFRGWRCWIADFIVRKVFYTCS